ncbi:MAG: hypothetical protein KJO39_11875 [Bacteroidia bacterium]|nr:hypothetical protein [Bacteroidia bacterium]NNF31863.1 hypothetical protein [Flavobacteriaceae bacterium]NNJ82692.1 hypothetical protein [Flavobacteriaceae bacterium]NNK53039.1 hypothetical protein [Flavobacteriaceae bacterium]NNM07758.1 hypothetical protein [Flavobacteriaceae bacterium]
MKASKETMRICDSHFGKLHHRNGKENAFRHALWNLKICEKCQKTLKISQKSSKWAEKVTNLYENVTKNESLEDAMDLHNNSVGRMLFLTISGLKMAKKVDILLKMMQKAVKITKMEELQSLKDQLVYISD